MPADPNRVKEALKREITELAAIYDTICETLSSQRADSNIIDVYALYDFVSALLMQLDPKFDSKLRPTSRNAVTLLEICAVIEQKNDTSHKTRPQGLLPLFFDYDKLYYDTNAIDAAMTTARCTQKQKTILWNLILQCITQSQEKSTIGQDITVTKELENEPFGFV
jgi:hypothetical protein